jgi:hypothetical protein
MIEEDPTALVARAALEPIEPVRCGKTQHLRQHPAERIRAGHGNELHVSCVGNRHCQRKRSTRRRQSLRCRFGSVPLVGRGAQEFPQCSAQIQRYPVIGGRDSRVGPEQAASAHPLRQQQRGRDLIAAIMQSAIFHIPALVERVHEIIEQRQLRRHVIGL